VFRSNWMEYNKVGKRVYTARRERSWSIYSQFVGTSGTSWKLQASAAKLIQLMHKEIDRYSGVRTDSSFCVLPKVVWKIKETITYTSCYYMTRFENSSENSRKQFLDRSTIISTTEGDETLEHACKHIATCCFPEKVSSQYYGLQCPCSNYNHLEGLETELFWRGVLRILLLNSI
jgi:hypothetical protein